MSYRDGSRPILDFAAQRPTIGLVSPQPMVTSNDPNLLSGSKGSYPGLPGLLHSTYAREIALDSELGELLGPLTLDQMQKLTFLFNFQTARTAFLGPKRVSMQLDDSEWSASFSLDNLEINQTIAADHPVRGALELGFKVKTAPGRLGKYTKIVRFMPRVIVLNNLDLNLKLLQPTGFSGKFREVPVTKGFLRPFHFPDINSEKKLSIKVDGPYQKTTTFGVDFLGEKMIAVTHQQDLSSIVHVNTRGTAEYEVFLPPQEIGLWFETDWQERNIVVRDYARQSFAANQTDIQIGDVLLAVDGEIVTGGDFERAMILIKEKLRHTGCTLCLRTVEEKMRLIRSAVDGQIVVSEGGNRRVRPGLNEGSFFVQGSLRSIQSPSDDVGNRDNTERLMLLSNSMNIRNEQTENLLDDDNERKDMFLENEPPDQLLMRIEVRQVEASVLVLIDNVKNKETEYRIYNHSLSFILLYKQRGIPGNHWRELAPGCSTGYLWDDPFKPRKLVLKVGANLLCPTPREEPKINILNTVGNMTDDFITQPISYLAGGASQDDRGLLVNFDEIGFKAQLSVPQTLQSLSVEVSSEGPAKTLNIFPAGQPVTIVKEIYYTNELLIGQSAMIRKLITDLVEKYTIRTSSEISLPSLTSTKRSNENINPSTETSIPITTNTSNLIQSSTHVSLETEWAAIEAMKSLIVAQMKTLQLNILEKIQRWRNVFPSTISTTSQPKTSLFKQRNKPDHTVTSIEPSEQIRPENVAQFIRDPLNLGSDDNNIALTYIPYESVLGDYDITGPDRLLIQVIILNISTFHFFFLLSYCVFFDM